MCAWLMSTVCWKLARSFSARVQVGLRQQRGDELRRDVERQRPLVVGHRAVVTAVWSLAACRRCCRFFPRSNR